MSQEVRFEQGREADSSAGTIGNQTVKASITGCFHGFDAGKHIKSIKRHNLVGTEGFLLTVVQSAAEQGFNATKWVLKDC